MSPLEALIRERIAGHGPITVADYLELALGHPEHGYYRTRDPLGAAGDFTTAPEISQMFGELLGLWCAEAWRLLGAPAPVRLVELGPGRGTLMADALRAIARAAPGFRAALELHLVETSPVLRQRQAAVLEQAQPRWHDTLAGVPPGPALVLANELLDALPIHQLVRTGAGWCERLVGLADDGALGFKVAAEPSPLGALLDPVVAAAPVGSLAEQLSPAVRQLAADLAARAGRDGGAALLIDYGHAESAVGETLQAVRAHRSHPVLDRPGSADLTAHVDFAAVSAAARGAGAATLGPVAQGDFLRRLGIVERALRLVAAGDAAAAKGVRAALARLIEPAHMGRLFKMLAVVPPHAPQLPGFAA